jgi:hypothetical protein
MSWVFELSALSEKKTTDMSKDDFDVDTFLRLEVGVHAYISQSLHLLSYRSTSTPDIIDCIHCLI